ncbi:MAG: TRAP transporter small permease [Limnochordia bacterium]|jgi:TRAP-type C4-dicarboxylate transport system permease small subunit
MRFLDRFENYAIIVLLSLMTILVFIATMARYVFFFPITWGEEAARYMMVWLAYIGASAGLKRGSHLGVEVFVSSLPKKWHWALDALRYLIIIVFNVLVIILAAQILRNQKATGQISPALEIPIYYAYAAVPFGIGLMTIGAVQQLIEAVATRNREVVATKGQEG